MAIDPVKIPQNVNIEDRIVGPLTLRQLIIIGLGGGFSYSLYATLSKAAGGGLPLIPTILVWIPAAIAGAFALVKINDLSLFRICLLILESMNKPKQRMFAPRQGLTLHIRTIPVQEPTAAEVEAKRQLVAEEARKEQRIRELSTVLDSASLPAEPMPPEPDPETIASHTESASEPDLKPTRFPVDPNKISANPLSGEQDGLSKFRNVFRDISPNS